MNGYRNGLLLLVGACAIFAQTLTAQDAWRRLILRSNGKPIETLREIGIPATAEYDGKKLNAYVFFSGYEKAGGTGHPDFGVLVEGIEKVVPPGELAQFEGPDLSEAARKENAISISTLRNKTERSYSTHLIFTGASLPPEIQGDENQVFETNIRSTKNEKKSVERFCCGLEFGFR